MSRRDLPVFILQHEGACSVHDAYASPGWITEASSVPARINAVPACFDADQLDGFVVHERTENTDGIGPASHAGDNSVWQPSCIGKHLFPRLAADHRLELADHGRVGVRPKGRAKQVMGI